MLHRMEKKGYLRSREKSRPLRAADVQSNAETGEGAAAAKEKLQELVGELFEGR